MLTTYGVSRGRLARCWPQGSIQSPSRPAVRSVKGLVIVRCHTCKQPHPWTGRRPPCGQLTARYRQKLAVRTAAAVGAATQSEDEDNGEERPDTLPERLGDALERLVRLPEVKRALQMSQFAASLLFVVLYVWSTYSTPQPFSWRANLDLFLCAVFAVDYTARYLEAESKARMVTGFWNILDLLAFLPPLLEACLFHGANVHLKLGRFDLRWFKILRALRVMRVSLLAGELKQMHLSSTGALLSGAASVRLFQLIASVLTLLFTTSSIVHLVERIPFHEALYFVTTTLTTVGYGDVVMRSTLGKAVVLAMICVGVVLIPVQTSQLYSQLTARRVTLGTVPDGVLPTVLVSTRLTEVRGFSDFFSEFFQALKKSRLPQKLRLVVLCNKPNFEFRAFQELNDKRLTLIEGSALSERDLLRARAESASACLLLADRFSPNPQEEDLNLQFQVWALKSYTKRIPVYVQVLQKSSLQLISPFLDPEQDVLVSMEQTRHRLLALSCLCPGASTLIANLLRRAAVSPRESQRRTAGGRRWLRAYLNGCAFKVFDAVLSPSLARVPFAEAAEWLYRTSGFVLMGVMRDKQVILNPGRRRLQGSETAIVIGTSQQAVDSALAQTFTAAGPLQPPLAFEAVASRTLEDVQLPGDNSQGIRRPVVQSSAGDMHGSSGPIDRAASWLSTLSHAVGIPDHHQPVPQDRESINEDEFFYPEGNMPCVLDSPYCKYDRFSAPGPSVPSSATEDLSMAERRRSHDTASTSSSDDDETDRKFVEGYTPIIASPWMQPEPSESFDEEDDLDARRGLRRTLRMTIEQFYTNLGDLTSPKRAPDTSTDSSRRSRGAGRHVGRSITQDSPSAASTEDVAELSRGASKSSIGPDGAGSGSNVHKSDGGDAHVGSGNGSAPAGRAKSSKSLAAGNGTHGAQRRACHREGVGRGSESPDKPQACAASFDSNDLSAKSAQGNEADSTSALDGDSEKCEKGESKGADVALELPQLTTESYDEDPEDEGVISGKELLALASAESESSSEEAVMVPRQQTSLERHRELAQSPAASGLQTTREKGSDDDQGAGHTRAKSKAGNGAKLNDSDQWSFDNQERDYGIEDQGGVSDVRLPMKSDARAEDEDEEDGEDEGLSNHIIMCGAEGSFVSFVQQVRRCDPISTSIVVLHPHRPKAAWPALTALGPVHFIQGNPSDAASLQKACASQARALVFLANAHRPTKAEDAGDGDAEGSFASRTAVLADAQGLLTCYGVGEDGAANLPHAVVELTFTSSVRFLQPGLLLKGQGFMDELPSYKDEDTRNQPRKSWQMRKRQERAAIKEGLAEWQANPYYCAGRVTVPALLDTFACQCFLSRGLLTDLMEELAGDDGRAGGAQLRQLPLPEGMAGRTYGELFASMTLTRKLLPLGLYRRKSENPAWRLYYVVTNPPPEERLDVGDRVFVLRERGGPWLTALPP